MKSETRFVVGLSIALHSAPPSAMFLYDMSTDNFFPNDIGD